jgi:release factor glutamine methyltransferase
MDNYSFKQEVFNNKLFEKKFLEVGFGDGDHLIYQIESSIKENKSDLYIGVEVYLNGVYNFLKNAINKKLKNFCIFPDDIFLIINEIPNNSLDGVYFLFPGIFSYYSRSLVILLLSNSKGVKKERKNEF